MSNHHHQSTTQQFGVEHQRFMRAVQKKLRLHLPGSPSAEFLASMGLQHTNLLTHTMGFGNLAIPAEILHEGFLQTDLVQHDFSPSFKLEGRLTFPLELFVSRTPVISTFHGTCLCQVCQNGEWIGPTHSRHTRLDWHHGEHNLIAVPGLFNLIGAQRALGKQVLVVLSPLDALLANQVTGLPTVATLGMTGQPAGRQIALLGKREVLLALDCGTAEIKRAPLTQELAPYIQRAWRELSFSGAVQVADYNVNLRNEPVGKFARWLEEPRHYLTQFGD